jgi:hypothetical protein
MPARGPVPTLSAVRSWDTDHLTDAATHWTNTATVWEDAFDNVFQQVPAPGGTPWRGDAAEAARLRAGTDRVKVIGVADELRAAATIARTGADELHTAKHAVLSAVAATESAHFTVGEDFSVTDRLTGLTPAFQGARQAQAQAFAADICARVGELIAHDQQVAANIITTMAPLREASFAEAPVNGAVQAVDFQQAPAPSPPYPINDVVAEATDLDGNHVLLRRGYYDTSTKQGFGWDKAYWKHGIVNINVFKDLISHSRPVSNEGGTLVYEVPIDRVHCTKGPLGIVDCADTGERVTMRIVVNINEPRPDLPDGGQKGVITMYPLPGGSGVVEVEPNWTLTPPWVNNNVPIN